MSRKKLLEAQINPHKRILRVLKIQFFPTLKVRMDDETIYKAIDAAFTNKITKTNYISRLRNLQSKLKDKTLYEILSNPDVYYEQIRANYESLTSRKNLLTTILVVFREVKLLAETFPEAHPRWKKLHDDLGKLQESKIRRSEPEDKQVEKYTSFEEIETKYDEMKKRGPHASLRESMQFLLLSVVVHLRPKRADLGNIHIYKEKDPRVTDSNYIVFREKGNSYLVMNMYKTSKYYQTVEEDLPEGLVNDIKASISRWPRDLLFQKEDGTGMSNNTYSVFVKKTFEHLFGRATGVSLLRHIYITEKLDFDNMTLEEQNQEAKLMLHTAGLQRAYKWPKKVICPKLCAAYITPTHRTRKIKRSKRRLSSNPSSKGDPKHSIV